VCEHYGSCFCVKNLNTFSPSGENVAKVDDFAGRIRFGDCGREASLPPSRHQQRRRCRFLHFERFHFFSFFNVFFVVALFKDTHESLIVLGF